MAIFRTACQAASRFGWALAPIAVGAAIKAQNTRISAIVGGVVLVGSGLYMTAKAAAHFANGGKKITCLTFGGLGLATTAMGIYCVATGVFNPSPKNCQERLEEARQAIISCPETRAIWEKNGDFSVRCADIPEGNGLEPNPITREILIPKDLEPIAPRLTGTFSGLEQWEDSKKLLQDPHFCNEGGADKFAEEMISIEYKFLAKANDAGHSCVNKGFWPKEWVASDNPPSNTPEGNELKAREEFLRFQEENGQPNLYRDLWKEICAKKITQNELGSSQQ